MYDADTFDDLWGSEDPHGLTDEERHARALQEVAELNAIAAEYKVQRQ